MKRLRFLPLLVHPAGIARGFLRAQALLGRVAGQSDRQRNKLRSRGWAGSWAALVCLAPAAAQDDADAVQTRPFQVYDSMEVRALQEEAVEHLQTGRWAEGIDLLQRLNQNHRGEVLPPSQPAVAGRLEGIVHVGAPAWARAQLFALEEPQREIYLRMVGNEAQAAMRRALEEGSVTQWLEIARRWPITPAAYRARWALGDAYIERGQTDEGLQCWARAMGAEVGRPEQPPQTAAEWAQALEQLDQAQQAGRLPSDRAERLPGIRYRTRMALDLHGRSESRSTPFANALRPGDFSARSLDQHQLGWPEPALLPDHPMEHPFLYQLQGAVADDRLLVNTSRQVLALDLWGGNTLWTTPLSLAGWTEREHSDGRFTEAVDFQGALFAPAVKDNIVVASLQLPFILIPPDHFRQIQIIRIVPERRLFAFDTTTGRMLWNTAPPSDWDGQSGTKAQRVSVAGPPTIAGSRVLVPTVHLRGRVEFHVDCFDLETGEHLWHTPLVTGQRELNMFSREISEFTAPPVTVVGDKVVVATSIGSVACLDLIRGDTLWQSLYSQIAISKATYYSPGQMRSLWIHSAPVVRDGLVFAAPNDCESLLCFDLDSGAHLWSTPHDEFGGGTRRRRSSDYHYLVDADAQRVILGGRRVAAFGPLHGTLREARPTVLQWAYPTGDTINNTHLRAVATGQSVLVPADGELVRVERSSGRPTSSLEWAGRKGSPVVTEVGLFTVGRNEVRGYFDWRASLAQAQQAYDADPTDGTAIYRLALLHQKRGLAARLARPTPDLDTARRSLRTARELLENRLGQPESANPPGLRNLLFETLLEEGRTLRLSAAPERARLTVEQALDLAQGPHETSQALLMLAAMDRGRDEGLRQRRLARLADEFGGLEVDCYLMALPENGDQPADYRYEPRGTLALPAGTEADQPTYSQPLGLWARVERIKSLARSSPRGSGSPYPDLYAILRHYADREWLGGTAGDWALRQLQDFRKDRQWPGMEAIEAQAEQALQLAVERGGDYELARVQRLYPFTEAADRAGDARVQAAAQNGDIGILAEVILGSAPLEFALERTTPKTRQQLALLAQAVGDAGGLTFRSELGKRLARSAPRQAVTLLGGIERDMRDWSMEWSAQVPVPEPAPAPTFSPQLRLEEADHNLVPGPSLWVPAALDAEGGPAEAKPMHLMTWRNPRTERLQVAAFSEELDPVWIAPSRARSVQLDPQVSREDTEADPSWVVSPGRVHAPLSDGVMTLGRERGERLWRWNVGSDFRLMSLVGAQGVLVATLQEVARSGQPGGEWLQVGLEAASGTELWRRRLSNAAFHPTPLVGAGAVVLFSTGPHSCQIFDLFSGAEGPKFRPARLRPKTLYGAWITDGLLLLPYFAKKDNTDLNHMEAFDLNTGQRVWRLPFGKDRELVRVLSEGGQTYLELRGYSGDNVTQFVEITPLDVARGQLAPSPTIQLKGDLLFLGIPKFSHQELDSPWLFVRTSRPGGYGLKALHLREGSKWETSLGEHISPVSPTSLPKPQISASAAVLALPKRGTNKSSPPSTYYILSYAKESGRPVSDLMVRLSGRHGHAPQWSVLGSTLVFGHARDAEVLGGWK